MQLKNEEMRKVSGGAVSISSIINAFSKLINTVYELGRSTGSAIRRLGKGKKSYCESN